jgi:hypothetical protein
MDLYVRRWLLTEETSVSEWFFVEGTFTPVMRDCYGLEDRYREPGRPKVFGKTCIPCGRYRVTIERSPRLSRLAGHDVFTPRLHEVPNFEGILIHPGNFERDTLGCLLPGTSYADDGSADRQKVTESVKAYEGIVLPKLKLGLSRGPVHCIVELAGAHQLVDKRHRAIDSAQVVK